MRKKIKLLSALKDKGGEHFKNDCGMGKGRKMSNGEGIEMSMTASERQLTFQRSASFKEGDLKSDCLTLLSKRRVRNYMIPF